MCKCVDIEIQTYSNITALVSPFWSDRAIICVDSCIAEEIQHLWEMDIVTNGSCCGHNQMPGFIGVMPESIDAMEQLGYQHYADRIDHFLPKTAKPEIKTNWEYQQVLIWVQNLMGKDFIFDRDYHLNHAVELVEQYEKTQGFMGEE